ncbi:MAG: hypothetical protein A2V66_06825 [Ignavibacteria bacterium RBG_13_36_8]|nr:MAG: hypothetical protein A2V66_06825 [Ignavibacteria bacterium RBG_13_36_8]
MRKSFVGFLVVSILFSVSIFAQTGKSDVILRMKSNLEFLSSDELEGRNASSRGERVAAQFIASEMKKYGVKPLGDDGTYFQNFDMSVRRFKQEPNLVLYDESGKEISKLTPGLDYLLDDSRIPDLKYLRKAAGLVFVGYGITAEEYGYDDYKNIDVNGKIVITLSGEPSGDDENYFKGAELTEYSSPRFKAQLAEKNGAVGLINIVNDGLIPYWNIYWSILMIGDFKWTKEEHSEAGGLPAVLGSLEGIKKIFDGEIISYDKILEMRNGTGKADPFLLKKKFMFDYGIVEGNESIRNVVGVIEGKDPQLKNEYVVLSAHYDHVYIYNSDVCNGADDNGSGVIAVLETADKIIKSGNNKRSIILLFVTAEEKGLLGSYYFTNNFPQIDNVVACINIDMCGRQDENSIEAIGADRVSKEFHELLEKANSETAKFDLDYSQSYTRSFELSDHYPFVRKNIPAFFLFDNMYEDLHAPKDEIQKINFEKIYKTVEMSTNLALKVSNLDHRMSFDMQSQ